MFDGNARITGSSGRTVRDSISRSIAPAHNHETVPTVAMATMQVIIAAPCGG